MKKTHFTALLLCMLLAACGPKKSDETTSDAATEETAAATDEAATDDATATEESTPAPAEETTPAKASDASASASTANKNTYTDAKGRTVYTFAEKAPAFDGGESEMNKWLRKNLKYPATDAEGTVFVSFVVGDDGGVSDAKVESGAEDQKLRDEALRVVSNMPKWAPGQQGGKAVPVKFTLPVTFKKSV